MKGTEALASGYLHSIGGFLSLSQKSMRRLKLFRSLQDSNMSITLGSRRSPVREELRGVVVDGAGDAPSLDAVLVLAVP